MKTKKTITTSGTGGTIEYTLTDNEKLSLTQKFDAINTEAVRWLAYNSDKHDGLIGITNFKYKDIQCKWLLQMFNNYNIITKKPFYIITNIFTFLYLRFIKKFNGLRFFSKKKKVFFIDSKVFIHDLIKSFDENKEIINLIYNSYYRR